MKSTKRTPRTLQFGEACIHVDELSTRLSFTCKPSDLGDLVDYNKRKVYVTETRELTVDEFDAFARRLLAPRHWLRGKGGGTGDGFLCVEVTAPGRRSIYVNPEGSDYGRYVAAI